MQQQLQRMHCSSCLARVSVQIQKAPSSSLMQKLLNWTQKQIWRRGNGGIGLLYLKSAAAASVFFNGPFWAAANLICELLLLLASRSCLGFAAASCDQQQMLCCTWICNFWRVGVRNSCNCSRKQLAAGSLCKFSVYICCYFPFCCNFFCFLMQFLLLLAARLRFCIGHRRRAAPP